MRTRGEASTGFLSLSLGFKSATTSFRPEPSLKVLRAPYLTLGLDLEGRRYHPTCPTPGMRHDAEGASLGGAVLITPGCGSGGGVGASV